MSHPNTVQHNCVISLCCSAWSHLNTAHHNCVMLLCCSAWSHTNTVQHNCLMLLCHCAGSHPITVQHNSVMSLCHYAVSLHTLSFHSIEMQYHLPHKCGITMWKVRLLVDILRGLFHCRVTFLTLPARISRLIVLWGYFNSAVTAGGHTAWPISLSCDVLNVAST